MTIRKSLLFAAIFLNTPATGSEHFATRCQPPQVKSAIRLRFSRYRNAQAECPVFRSLASVLALTASSSHFFKRGYAACSVRTRTYAFITRPNDQRLSTYERARLARPGRLAG